MQTLQALSVKSNEIADAFAASPSIENCAKLKDRCDIILEAFAYISNNAQIFNNLKWKLNTAPSFSISAELPNDMASVLNSFGSIESRKNGVSYNISNGQMKICIMINTKGTSYVSMSADTSDQLFNIKATLAFVKQHNLKLKDTADAVAWHKKQIDIMYTLSDILMYSDTTK